MSKKTIAEASSEMFSLLKLFSPDERMRIVRGTLTLLGDSGTIDSAPAAGHDLRRDDQTGTPPMGGAEAGRYFAEKNPTKKVEELAVAARFKELQGGGDTITNELLASVYKAARRNFDRRNYSRDMDNARKAGLFNKGGKTGTFSLSYYGQSFVDALPNRDATKALRKPKPGARGGKKKRAG